MPFESLQQIISYQPPPVKQYIDQNILMEYTKLCFFGGPKMFKSLAVVQLGFCIAAGKPWLGFNTTQGKVAYVQSEVGKILLRERIIKIHRNVVIPNNSFLFETNFAFKLDRNKDLQELEKSLIASKPDILIFDPWYKMLSIEDNVTYSKTQDIMDYLIDQYKLSVIMVHHDTVPQLDMSTGKPMTFFHPRGPRTVEGFFDTIIQIDGDIQTDERRLTFESRHAINLVRPVDIGLDRNTLWMSRII